MPRHPLPASTTSELGSSIFQVLARRVRELADPPLPLHVGDTWLQPLPAARAEAQREADHPGLHRYALPHGEPALLDAVALRTEAKLGRRVEASELQVVSGATVGLSLCCQTVLAPGDEVLVLAPYWPLTPGIVASRGAVPVEVPVLHRLDEPDFDLEAALEDAVTERTAALCLNTPHNPTGRVLGEAELDAVAAVAGRHDLWILSDDVYEELAYDTARPPCPMLRPDCAARTLSVHGLSKSHGLAGARVGWVHGPPEILSALRRVQVHQVYCAARPMQLAGAKALRDGDEWLAEARSLYRKAAETAAAALGLPVPAAGTFLFFDASPWSEGGDDALPFLERCLEAGVLLTPGASCGAAFSRWARLCFTSVPPAQLELALERLLSVMR